MVRTKSDKCANNKCVTLFLYTCMLVNTTYLFMTRELATMYYPWCALGKSPHV